MKTDSTKPASFLVFLVLFLLVEKSEGGKMTWLVPRERGAEQGLTNDYKVLMDPQDSNSDEELELLGAYNILRNVLGHRWEARQRQAVKRGCAVFRGGIQACLKAYETRGRWPNNEST
ncbi:PREDICTED: uncharacterized protein LOC109477319 [Branchiostoma belcheri]|uniref:Uncharacterized protein LOC109477319 n=1 Tax=Branchiostoma belcheri TaxID=7741 RepID=A0A6P4ZSY1_BRABE|nr:PREDICTED: uncharacterized protein LOC109477319 [Branchiostoma belcheri]